MKTVKLATLIAVAGVASGAHAGETPYGSHAGVHYYSCIAMPSANGQPTYVSPVFADSANAGQQALNDAFRRYLAQKYALSGQNGACVASGTAEAAEAAKKDSLRFAKNVIETGWTPSS